MKRWSSSSSWNFGVTAWGIVPYTCIGHLGMCSPQRVGFLRRFGLKTGIDFAYFGLESGMVFEETTGVDERIYRFKDNSR